MEDIDVARQHVRSAAAVGAKVLRSARLKEILFDDFSDPEGEVKSTSSWVCSYVFWRGKLVISWGGEVGSGKYHPVCVMSYTVKKLPACAEGITLGLFSYDKMKSKKATKGEPTSHLIRLVLGCSDHRWH